MRNKQVSLLAAIVLTFAACSKQGSNALEHAQVCYADTAQHLSFSRDIVPVLQAHCALSGCHTGSAPTGGLNLDAAVAYQQLTRAGSGYIDTSDPRASILYAQLFATSNPMPPTGKLDTCTTQLILRWIVQKAPNN